MVLIKSFHEVTSSVFHEVINDPHGVAFIRSSVVLMESSS